MNYWFLKGTSKCLCCLLNPVAIIESNISGKSFRFRFSIGLAGRKRYKISCTFSIGKMPNGRMLAETQGIKEES
jgi:hypothetical protein